MFRYGKIIDSNAKVSRSDRFAEMSKQQRLIEQKKQEIKAKFEERRRQEAEEALKKLASKAATDNKIQKDIKAIVGSRIQSWKNDERWRKKCSVDQDTTPGTNVFSNDGSFLEQYKKIAEKEPPDSSSSHNNDQNIPKDSESVTVDRCNNEARSVPGDNVASNVAPQTTDSTLISSNRESQKASYIEQPSFAPRSPAIYSAPNHYQPTAPYHHQSPYYAQSGINFVPPPPPPPFYQRMNFPSPFQQSTANSKVQSFEPAHAFQYPTPTLTTNSYSNQYSTGNFGPIAATRPPPPPPPCPSSNTPNPGDRKLDSTNVESSQNDEIESEIDEQTNEESNYFRGKEDEESSVAEIEKKEKHTLSHVSKSGAEREEDGDVEEKPTDEHTCNDNLNDKYDKKESLPDQSNNDGYDADGDDDDDDCQDNDNKDDCSSTVTKKTNKLDKALESMKTIARIVAECGDHMEQVFLQKHQESDDVVFLVDKFSPPYIAYRHMVEKFRRELKPQGFDDIDGKKYSDENGAKIEEFEEKGYSTQSESDTVSRSDQRSVGELEEAAQENRKKFSKTSKPLTEEDSDSEDGNINEEMRRKRRKRSRWAPESSKVDIVVPTAGSNVPLIVNNSVINSVTAGSITAPIPPSIPTVPVQLGQFVQVGPSAVNPLGKLPGVPNSMISQVTRTDPALLQYAMQSFGTTNLSEEDWKKAEDHYKLNLLYQDMLRKREELEKLRSHGKNKYEYDSDEDTEGGTWEHKLRMQEMTATQIWADELTEKAKGKHHIGDFLPPDELERFMEKYNALKQGREPDLSDYKEYKLKQDNIGFQMLQKLGWVEGQGLGSDGTGIVDPVNKAPSYMETHGLGIEKPDDVTKNDDEYDAYRKRMMLAYRFRPNPLNNPRRPYY